MKWIFLSVDGMFCYVCFQQYSLSSSLVFTEFLLIVKSFKNNCDSVKREVLIELGAFCHNSLKKWTLAGPCSCCLVYMSVFFPPSSSSALVNLWLLCDFVFYLTKTKCVCLHVFILFSLMWNHLYLEIYTIYEWYIYINIICV